MKGEKGLFTVVHQIKQLSGMPPILQAAYMWICYYSNQEGYCFPSQKLLAENCGVSINAIRKYLLALEKMGLIQRERRYKDNMEISSMYQLVIGISNGGGGVYHHVGEGIAPNGDGTKSTELNLIELNIDSQEIQKEKINKEEWEEYKNEIGFGSLIASSLIEIGWKPNESVKEFQKWVDKILTANKIEKCDKDYSKLSSGLIGFVEYYKGRKVKNYKSTLSGNFCLRFNIK